MKTHDGSIKSVLHFAFPLIVSQASFTVMQFFGRLFLSWYGRDELAASVPSGVFSFLMVSFFMGVASYSNVFIAQYYGRKNFNKLTVYLWQSVFFSLGAALIMLALVPLGLSLLSLSTHNPQILALERSYYRIAVFAGILSVLNTALAGFFTGRGETKVTMFANFLGNIVNVVICYLLVFGFAFGFAFVPAQGIAGTAYGLIAGNLCVTLCYLFLVFSKKNRETYHTVRLIKFNKKHFKRFLSFGVPNGISFFLDISAFSAFIFFIGNISETALAANNITLSLESLAFLPILGIGIATSTLVGQMIGMSRYDLAIRSTYSALKLNLMYTGFLGLCFLCFPHFFINFFIMKDPVGMQAIAEQTVSLMRLLAYFILIDAVGLTFASAIKGAGDTRFQMLASVLSSWFFFIPGIYILSVYYKFPVETMWIWASVHLSLMAIVFYWRFKSNHWQKIKLIEKGPVDEGEEMMEMSLNSEKLV